MDMKGTLIKKGDVWLVEYETGEWSPLGKRQWVEQIPVHSTSIPPEYSIGSEVDFQAIEADGVFKWAVLEKQAVDDTAEVAEALIQKWFRINPGYGPVEHERAILNAGQSVDQLIEENRKVGNVERYKYWREVKKNIEKL